MKASDSHRAYVLTSARSEWQSIVRACRKKGRNRGLELIVGSLHIDADCVFVEDHEASVTIDCVTGLLVAEAALKIINAELKKLGVK